MRKRRSALVWLSASMLTVSATLGGTAAAAAAKTPPAVSRAQFIYQFDRADNIQPVYPQVPDFTDVPSSSPYYGYIEAAFKAGIISGVTASKFEPNASLTRDEIAKIEVLALGDGTAAQALASQATTFKDDASIPSWARGYVNEAVKLGLISGYPNGHFKPGQAITTADTPHFLQKFSASQVHQGTWSLSMTASGTNVGVGQQVQLTSVVKNPQSAAITGAQVTYSVGSSSALISGDIFIASSPGIYTVTGTYQAAGGPVTGSVTIDVYGTPAALKIVAPSQIAANGYSQYTVTVDIVDQNGNVVANNNTDQVTLAATGGGAISAINPGTTTAVNGVATFTITSGQIPGSTTTLTATDPDIPGSGHQATTTVTSSLQSAATLSISAPQYISVNQSGTTAVIRVQVLDQSGQPMLYGTFPFTVSLSGPATFAGGGTAAQNFVYSGNGQAGVNAPYATVTIQDIQGYTGTISVTATGTNMTSATATIQAVVSGVATGISIYPPATTSIAQTSGSTGLAYGISAIDAHGYPVSDPIPVLITVKNSSGGLATNIYVDGQPQNSTQGGYLDTNAMANGKFTLTVYGSSGSVGTYTVQASSPTQALSSSATDPFTIAAGTVVGITATMSSAYVSALNPQTTVVVQAVDLYGNPVGQSGIPVTLSNASSNAYPVSLSATTGYTNANGQFIATVTVTPYVHQIYTVNVSATVNGATKTPPSQPTVSVQNTVATSLQVTPVDIVAGSNSDGHYVNSNYVATSSDTVSLTFKALDQYQNAVGTNDQITLSFSGAGSLKNLRYAGSGASVPENSSGQYTLQLSGGTATIDAEAWAAGSTMITAQDTSIGDGPTTTFPIMILAGNLTGFDFFSMAGANVSTPLNSGGSGIAVVANTPVEVYLEPVDAQGNPTVAGQASTAVLSDGGQGGSFRPNNPYSGNVTTYSVAAGTTSQPFWYVNVTSNTYYLTATYLQTPTTLTLSSLPTNMTAGQVQQIELTSKDQYGTPLKGTFAVTITAPSSGPDLLQAGPNGALAIAGSGVNSSGVITSGTPMSTAGTGTVNLTFTNGTADLYIQPVDAQSNASVNLQVNGTSAVASTSNATVVSAGADSIVSATAPTGNTVVGNAYNYQITAQDAYGNPANGPFDGSLSLTVGGLAVSPNGAEPTVLGVAATTSGSTTTVVIPAGTATGDLGSSALSFTNGTADLPVMLTSATSQTLTFKLSNATSAVTANAAQTSVPGDTAYLVLETPSGKPTSPEVAFPAPSYQGGPWTLATVEGSTYGADITGLANGTIYQAVIQLVDAYGNPITSGTDASQTFTINLTPGTGSTSYLGTSTTQTSLSLTLSGGSVAFLYNPTGSGYSSYTDTLTIPKPTNGVGEVILNLTFK